MAVAEYFISATNGNDANDGKDNIGVNLAGTVIWTESTFTITEAAGHGYTFATGDVIYIDGGTGAAVGLYEVVSSTATEIVLKETSTLPRVGNASDFAAGDLATGDITSSDGPWQTIDQGMNSVQAADDQIFWCRAEATYSESPSIDTAITSLQQTCTFEGYTTTLGDDGKITIVGLMTDSIATRIHYCFKNIIFDANSANDQAINLGSYEIMFRRCEFLNGNENNARLAASSFFWDCDFNDAANDGISCGSLGCFFNCRFYRNGASGIDGSQDILCWNCTFFSNAANAADGAANNETHLILINCTIDGDSKDTTIGVTKSSGFRGMVAVINTIIYDCATGADSHNDERDLYLNNLFSANTADFAGSASDQEGTHVTDAPDFVNEAAGADYTLNSGSPAVGAGHDEDNEMDIGAHQLAGGGAGGGLLMPNKRGGKQ